MSRTVLLLPGDGIGPEVVREARRVLDWANARYALDLSFVEANLGGVAIDRDGAAYQTQLVSWRALRMASCWAL